MDTVGIASELSCVEEKSEGGFRAGLGVVPLGLTLEKASEGSVKKPTDRLADAGVGAPAAKEGCEKVELCGFFVAPRVSLGMRPSSEGIGALGGQQARSE